MLQSIKSLNPFRVSKRTVVIVATAIVLAVSMFAVAPGISYAGPATSPSGCGTCGG